MTLTSQEREEMNLLKARYQQSNFLSQFEITRLQELINKDNEIDEGTKALLLVALGALLILALKGKR